MLTDPDLVVDNLGEFRRQILVALDKPDSATGLAKRLGSTRQKVNYHLRTLEDAGLVELVETRQRRGLEERIVQRTTDVVIVDPLAFDVAGLANRDVAGLAGVVSTATDIVRQAATVANQASVSGQRLAMSAMDTSITVATPQAFRSMQREIADVVARYDSEDGLQVRVSTLLVPEEEK